MITANTGHVMTVANSIIGVGILAMPFCFQKCGVLLSIVLLILNYFATRLCCHYLIKASILTRRKSFEFLAFHAFGSSGKLMVELCIIGYLIGTCIAYFVVVGDLGPQIIAKVLNVAESDSLRTWVMITVTCLCIIPLAMLKNVDSLATVCTASIGFYICLVVKVIGESKTHIIAQDWMDNVEYWKPSGALQCLPIFSMALSCQMQLFEVFVTVTNASLEKMNKIVKTATMICMCVYTFVGIFGYIAFCTQEFAGNILINFSPSLASDAIKMGFVLSIAFSFPLVIFPCRASIYSLLYRRGHADTTGYIPELRFKTITLSIVLFSLCMALMIPSIELVIGLVGSTIGVVICIMFPASCFMKISKKDSTEKRLAQFILISGFCLMILGTYANLLAIDEKHSGQHSPVAEEINVMEKVTTFENLSKNMNPTLIEKSMDLPKIVLNEDIKLQKERKNEENVEKLQLSNNNVKILKNVEAQTTVKPEVIKSPLSEMKISEVKLSEKKSPKVKEININQNSGDINKDAIKKEDEIVAEEAQKPANEMNKAEIELKETKKLLEKKVDELKEQLKQQNEETKNLVEEKLGGIVEKVQQIEREVHKESANLDAKNLDVEKPIDPLDKTQEKIDYPQKQDTQKLDNAKTKTKNVKQNENETVRKEIPSIPKGSLINMITDKKEKQKKSQIETLNNNTNIAFEPLSYKTGEIINKIKKNAANETRSPLPLPLLINSSIPKVIQLEPKKKEEIPTANEKPLSPQINKKDEPNESNNNIESIRRDILQARTEKNPANEAVSSPSITEAKREKRNAASVADRDSCINWDAQLNYCLDQKAIDSMLPRNMVNLEIESIGRELKSIKDKN